jgi:hypothetical protein
MELLRGPAGGFVGGSEAHLLAYKQHACVLFHSISGGEIFDRD